MDRDVLWLYDFKFNLVWFEGCWKIKLTFSFVVEELRLQLTYFCPSWVMCRRIEAHSPTAGSATQDVCRQILHTLVISAPHIVKSSTCPHTVSSV